MKNITARRVGVVAAFLILIGAFAISNLLSRMKEPPKRREMMETVKKVKVMTIVNQTIPTTLPVQGQLVAFDKIDLYAEVSGTLLESSRPFKVGSYFPKDAVLARIDSDEARLNLLSQKSNLLNSITQLMPDLKVDYPGSFDNWKAYIEAFDMEAPIRPLPDPANDQEKYFVASRNLYSQYYSIRSAEERLSKYVVSAPFSGVLTEASIHPGALVRTGQKLGALMSTGYYELEVTVPLSDLKYIRPGNEVSLFSDDIEGTWTGKIKRINDQIDPGTQTVKVFIGVSGKDLREGMYLRGEVRASSVGNAVKLPRDLIVAPGSIYLVRDSVLHLKEVEVIKYEQDSAIVRGLEQNTIILKEMIPDAFDGMKIRVEEQDAAASTSTAQNTPDDGSL